MTDAIRELDGSHIFLDHTSNLTTEQVHTKCVRLKRGHGLDLVVIDALEWMQTPGKCRSDAAALEALCRAFKALALELQVAVIAVSGLPFPRRRRNHAGKDMATLHGHIVNFTDLILLLSPDRHCCDASLHCHANTIEVAVICNHRESVDFFRLGFRPEFRCFEGIPASPLVTLKPASGSSHSFRFSHCSEMSARSCWAAVSPRFLAIFNMIFLNSTGSAVMPRLIKPRASCNRRLLSTSHPSNEATYARQPIPVVQLPW